VRAVRKVMAEVCAALADAAFARLPPIRHDVNAPAQTGHQPLFEHICFARMRRSFSPAAFRSAVYRQQHARVIAVSSVRHFHRAAPHRDVRRAPPPRSHRLTRQTIITPAKIKSA